MKTKPAKLLMALLLGMGSVAFVATTAYAEDSKDSKDSKDSGDGKSTSTAPKCTGQVISDCGVKFVLTTCTGSTVASSSKDKDGKDEGDDKNHESKAKDSDGKNDRDRYDESHRDHADRSGDAKEGKIAVCHRMGGAAVSLVVANDGWLSGHSKHALDTVGRCEDFDAAKKDDDSKEDKDKDHKVSASDVGYSIGLTTTQVACLNKYNTSNSTISIQAAGQGPSRGGARTLH
ncbi:MAG: hypothetical protein PHH47_07705 [Gallionella sp.]|nr:hypothetical protein [Gallionella sp.]MDD4945325.1 hypothetical protein [Gallionella sp.]MDD5612672.1 hypothetical protein [Gallionella sp.]